MAVILVADDDGHIREVVRFALEKDGHRVVEAADGAAALQRFAEQPVDVVVLDIVMPELDGIGVCRALRAKSPVPILFLSSRDEELDRILGLEIGADDYVTKPFSPRELTARVKAVMRRAYGQQAEAPQETYQRGKLRIDFDTYEVYVDGQRVELSLREFELLRFFVQHPNRVYERAQLLELVWGPDTFVEPRTIDVHIRRLRRRIERDDSAPELIVTVRGVGYMFDERRLGA